MAKTERPDIVEDRHLEFLDDLRDSGETNMWGAPAYVKEEFDVSDKESKTITQYWMGTFGNEDR